MYTRYQHLFEFVAFATFLVLPFAFGTAPRAFADTSSSTPSNIASTMPASDDSASTTPGALILTGDASSKSDGTTSTNTNVLNSDASTTPSIDPPATTTPDTDMSSSTPLFDEATDTPNTASSTPEDASTTLSVTTGNAATTTSVTAAAAVTGNNTAASGSGTSLVLTGNAYAAANSVNIVNTNIVDSAGLLYFKNLFSSAGIDLRGLDLSYFINDASSTSGCTLSACPTTTATTENAATTTSTVTVVANTGDNQATSTTGAAAIGTGNAYASGNSVNLVNTNVLNSNYLLVGVNTFGNLGGDIVLPSASFFEQLLAHDRAATSTQIATNNHAVVVDSTSASADTGGNTATGGTGTSTVLTGNALSSATSLNQVNTNQVGGTTIYFLFRVWGQWQGTVQGLPSGMTWSRTPLGIQLQNTDGSPASIGELAKASTTPDDASSTSPVIASTTNDANLTTNVHVYALTGHNEAHAGNSASVVETGNAYAAANSVNIVNTNLVGTNWIYAFFNIFGNFSGSIDFGQPDLWIGASAKASNPTLPDTSVPFHFTVANKGDAEATDVRLHADFPQGTLSFSHASSTASTAVWDLGSFAPGEAKDFTYTARTGSLPSGSSENVPVTVTVTSAETDGNPSDNTDHLSLVIANPPGAGGGATFTSDPKLSVTDMVDPTATTTPATVDYTVDILNTGGPAFNALATDVLRDPSGTIVNTQHFNLDTINNEDEIKIRYSIAFGTDTPPGPYTDTVTVTGAMHYPVSTMGSTSMPPVSATSTLTLLSTEKSDAVCPKYLTGYVSPGASDNDPAQVKLLQEFLINDEAENGVSVTGTYDQATIQAIDRFQAKYAHDVLLPWGYNHPTGYVYYTTQQKINDIYCNGRRTFGLSSAQLAEISSVRTLITTLKNAIVTRSSATSTTGTSTETTTSTITATSSPTITLPAGIRIGLMTTPVATSTVAPPHHTFLANVLGAQQLLMASVFNAFSSAVASITNLIP